MCYQLSTQSMKTSVLFMDLISISPPNSICLKAGTQNLSSIRRISFAAMHVANIQGPRHSLNSQVLFGVTGGDCRSFGAGPILQIGPVHMA